MFWHGVKLFFIKQSPNMFVNKNADSWFHQCISCKNNSFILGKYLPESLPELGFREVSKWTIQTGLGGKNYFENCTFVNVISGRSLSFELHFIFYEQGTWRILDFLTEGFIEVKSGWWTVWKHTKKTFRLIDRRIFLFLVPNTIPSIKVGSVVST